VLKPEISKKWLYFVSGFLWLGVGLFLCIRAYFWLRPLTLKGLLIFISALFPAYFLGRFALSRIAFRNLKRLDEKPERICCFAFQPLRSYFLIAVMVGLGITLRRLTIPRALLAFLYTLMGGALLTASKVYFEGALKRLQKS